ncbi:MAG: ABC transporter substrate-binding protein [Anaerolineae bacterium]
MKKSWLLLSVLLLVLAACAPAAAPTPTSAKVRVGYLLGDLHHIAYIVGQDAEAGGGKSFFEKYGVTVEDAPGAPYANGGVEMDHFAAGDVDMGYLGAPPAIIKHLNAGVKTTVVGQVNEIGSALIVAEDINRFSDLVGKTVATPGHATIQFFLLRNYAQQQGVDISQINIVDVAPKDMRAKLESGAVAGYIAWEPYASDSVVAGVGKILATSDDIWPHHLDCVLAVDQTFAKREPDTVVRFLKAHREATTWVQEALANPGSPQYRHLIDLAVKFTQRDAAVVEAAFRLIDYKVELSPTFRESFIEYTNKLIEFKVIGPDKLPQMGYQDTADFAARYIDLSYLEKAK